MALQTKYLKLESELKIVFCISLVDHLLKNDGVICINVVRRIFKTSSDLLKSISSKILCDNLREFSTISIADPHNNVIKISTMKGSNVGGDEINKTSFCVMANSLLKTINFL